MGEDKKQMLTREEYGDLVTDCAESAVFTAIGPFFLGIIGIPVSLNYLDKFVRTGPQVKSCASVVGAVALGIYTIKQTRKNCEEKFDKIYKP